MDTRRLRYFAIAAEEENFHRAAERLHIAQPALSKQIALLEQELGCTLFIRHKRRVQLSPLGRLFLEDAQRILRDMERAAERLSEASRGHSGTLRVGFRETAGRAQAVSGAISQFRRRYPAVELSLQQLTSPAQCDALRAGELDAGFVYLSPAHDHDLERLVVARDHFYLALHPAHRLAERKRIRLRDLVDEPFIWLARSRLAYYAETLMRTCIEGGLVPRVIQEADSEATILNLVAVGLGVSFVVSTDGRSPQPGVLLKPVAELREQLTLALVWSAVQSNPLTDNFIAIVREFGATTDGR
jgi:DNA-binding transcriptional LysR family regulator